MAVIIKRKENLSTKESILKDKARDSRPVKGIFHNHETHGGTLRFSFKAYDGDPVVNYEFNDGEWYTIPRGVADHLNNNCWYPINKYLVDEKGRSSTAIGKKVARFSFQSMDFMELEQPDLSRELLTVTPLQQLER